MLTYVSCLLFALVAALLTPISAGAQADVDCVAIIDAGGTRVARTELIDDFQVRIFYIEHNGFAVPLMLRSQTIRGTSSVKWFTDTDCSSTPYASHDLNPSPTSVVIGQEVHYSEFAAVDQKIQLLSSMSDTRSCQPENSLFSVAPLIHQFTLPQYTPPFTIEPEPCSAPPDPEQVINGCVSKNGTLKIVNDPVELLIARDADFVVRSVVVSQRVKKDTPSPGGIPMCRSALIMLLAVITTFVVYSPLPAGAVELQSGDLLYMGGAVGNTLYRLDTVTGEREVISGCFVTGGSDCVLFPDQFNRGTGPIWQGCPDDCHASALPNGFIAVVGWPQGGSGQPNGFTLYIVDPATGDRTSIANMYDGNGHHFGPGAMDVVAFESPAGPDPEQIINACVKNKGGAMRMVEDPADCTSRETPITLLSP